MAPAPTILRHAPRGVHPPAPPRGPATHHRLHALVRMLLFTSLAVLIAWAVLSTVGPLR